MSLQAASGTSRVSLLSKQDPRKGHMKKYLLFQIYGSMQSWGVACPGTYRFTQNHPTKSGLVSGIIGACLGIDYQKESDLRELFDTTGYACRIDIPGVVHEDYQTISREIKDEIDTFTTIESYRYYLAGALFTACLWKDSSSKFSLEAIAEKLNAPVFIPYLGRATCLAGLPFDPKILEAKDLRGAFSGYASDRFGFIKARKDRSPRIFWEGDDNSIPVLNKVFRQDVPKNRKTWAFGRRIELEGRL